MKLLFNLTTNEYDLARFAGADDLLSFARGFRTSGGRPAFDGVELMYLGPDAAGVVKKTPVIGLHAEFCPYWLDYFNADEARLSREFGCMAACHEFYGADVERGVTFRKRLVEKLREQIALAKKFRAQYMVFHACDVSPEEVFTGVYAHADGEVADAVAELVNEALIGCDYAGELLFENLWTVGMTLVDPNITQRLLSQVKYERCGIMLDTGHLMHMEPSLKTQEEAGKFVLDVIERNAEFLPRIRGLHLHQSLTGEYMMKTRANPPQMPKTFAERYGASNWQALLIDEHRPFTACAVRDIIERVAPEYVNLEYVTRTREEHAGALWEGLRAIGGASQLSLENTCRMR